MTPIRVTYRENVDHFVEASAQLPMRPMMSGGLQRKFFAALIGGTFLYFCVEEYIKTRRILLPLLAVVFGLLIMAFWWWFFKKIGLVGRGSGQNYRYQWSEKSKARFQNRYQKATGNTETLATCQFEDAGFRLNLDLPQEKFHAWNSLFRAIERPKGLLVYPKRHFFFWFPRASFASKEDFQTVINAAAAGVKNFERFDLSSLAFVALGSNLGDSRVLIQQAIERLGEFSTEPLLVSSLWQTTPVDCPPGSPPFLNAVIGFQPTSEETPESLLKDLQSLEKKFGRKPKKVMNEARPLDLDLIAFGRETRNTQQLTLPHPRARERRFVLQPLAEIAPDLILPGQIKTVAELLAALPPDPGMAKFE